MDEYTASRTQVRTIINAAQSIRECLTCSICLDYFEKPVTIKCGHKFCHGCILGVANNDNASCPLCNTKFQKRSIHKESNKRLESCVEQFKVLSKAIQDDSGIDVFEPCHTAKNSKESVFPIPKPSTSRVEEASTSSKGSTNTKIRTAGKRVLQKKSFTPKTRTTRRTKNTLERYLSAKSICTPDEKVGSQDKVESWLKLVEHADADNEVPDEVNKDIIEDTDNEAISNPEDSPLIKHDLVNQPSTSKSCFTEMKQSCEKPLPYTYPSTSKGTTKYKETEMRIQEAEMMARKKKLNQTLTDRAILKTPSSVPAASHSDAHDWRRVKRVGKEMQVKTFKSLNVSKEKSSSSIVLDDTVPCNLKTPEKSRNVCDLSNPEITPKTKASSSQLQENELPGNLLNSPPKRKLSLKMKSSDSTSSKSTRSHISTPDEMHQNKTESPINVTPDRPKSRLSLRLQTSKPAEHKLCLKKSPNKNQDTTNINKQKLSLKISPTKNQNPISSNEQKSSQKKTNKNQDTANINNEHKLSLKSPNKNQNPISALSTNKSKSAQLPNSKIVLFRKLGKICKKPKYIPFKKLGRLYPRILAEKTGVKVISNENVNVDISCIKVKRKVKQASDEVKMVLPEEDSQLKFFTVEASPCAQQVSRKTLDGKSPVHESAVNETRQTIMTMEIDESLPSVTIVTSQRKEIEDNKTVINGEEVHSETTNYEPTSPTSNCKKPEGIASNENEHKLNDVSSTTCEKVMEDMLKTNIDNHGESSKKDTNFKSINHKNVQKNLKSVEVLDDAISISSNDSESRNLESHDTRKRINYENIDLNRKNKDSEAESATSESSLLYVPKQKEKSDEKKSVSSSRSSSPLRTSPLKKKRTHSESSNDDDDDDLVTSIIGKWTNAKPVVKKPKVIENNQKDFDSDDNEQTLVEDESKQPEFIMPQRDPPIDDIISKVKSFKEQKEDDYSVNKLTGLPSSLQSADLFESNDSRLRVEANKQFNEVTSDTSSVSTWNPNKESDKENVNQSFEAMEPQSETTIVDLLQFDGKKSNGSVCSNSSNKENNACNKVNADSSKIEDQVNNMESSPNDKRIAEKSHDSPLDSYHVPDSLMNITQEQLALKMIEKDLMGADLSTVNNNENRDSRESNKFATPRRKVANSRVGNNNDDDDFDSESIDATPVAKKRRIFRQCQSKSSAGIGVNSSEIFSPEKSLQLIPAVTPMRNRTSYPLCHSTPMMLNTPSPEKQSKPQGKSMTLICSGLSPDNVKIVQNFAKKFNATFLVAFSDDVTHVIVATDPETKIGQKTFKYIQGIAFKKHVINFQWVLDCLDENAILDEDDEKYDVLDPDILECGPRRSRKRVQDLFENFAFYCLEPFSSISLADFKSLLVYNGAVVTTTVKELCLRKDKYRVIIFESEEFITKKLAALKKLECVMVSFEWVVDSISQYQIVSLFAYLHETSPEKAVAVGLPPSYLKEEEEEEEEEDEEE